MESSFKQLLKINQWFQKVLGVLFAPLSLLGADQFCGLMRFKLIRLQISRLWVLGSDQGEILDSFLKIYSGDTKALASENSSEHTQEDKDHKFKSFFEMPLPQDILEYLTPRILTFCSSWILKLFASACLLVSIKIGRINRPTCYLIKISQKLHLIVLHFSAPEILYYSLSVGATSLEKNNQANIQNNAQIYLVLLALDIFELSFAWRRNWVSENLKDHDRLLRLLDYKFEAIPLQTIGQNLDETQQSLNTQHFEGRQQDETEQLPEEQLPIIILDQVAMIRKLKLNDSIKQLWMGNSKWEPKKSNKLLQIIGNTPILLRTLFQHLIVVVGYRVPRLALALLMILEILHIMLNTFCREKLLKPAHQIPLGLRLISSTMNLFFILCFWVCSFFRDEESNQMGMDQQNVLVWIIYCINFTEYLNSLTQVCSSCCRLKKLYLEENREGDIDCMEDFLVFRRVKPPRQITSPENPKL